MSGYETVVADVDVNDGVGIITLNRRAGVKAWICEGANAFTEQHVAVFEGR